MIDFGNFYKLIAQKRPTNDPSSWLEILPTQLANWKTESDSRFNHWVNSIAHLPEINQPIEVDLTNGVTVKTETPISVGAQQRIEKLLKKSNPLAQRPFDLHGVVIDSEWRSDLKWQRLRPILMICMVKRF
ncbi:DUF1698 domain-containing protein [Orbaceae bacterium ESL0721]|nr:DUF1698 domain-containing protein [Orbaceae bacterium ESL0721]